MRLGPMLRSLGAISLFLGFLIGQASACSRPGTLSLQQAAAHPDFVNLTEVPEVTLSMRYAGANNFLKTNLYADRVPPLLHKLGALRLRQSAAFLAMEMPGSRLLVWDALRPRSVQRQMWSRVSGTPQEKYVADPERGSVHNFGFAVDLTVVDRDGRPLDMGTDFDDFRALAEPAREAEHLAAGLLSPKQRSNRLLLRRVMLRSGFEPLSTEWWHFDALPAWAVRERYVPVE